MNPAQLAEGGITRSELGDGDWDGYESYIDDGDGPRAYGSEIEPDETPRSSAGRDATPSIVGSADGSLASEPDGGDLEWY